MSFCTERARRKCSNNSRWGRLRCMYGAPLPARKPDPSYDAARQRHRLNGSSSHPVTGQGVTPHSGRCPRPPHSPTTSTYPCGATSLPPPQPTCGSGIQGLQTQPRQQGERGAGARAQGAMQSLCLFAWVTVHSSSSSSSRCEDPSAALVAVGGNNSTCAGRVCNNDTFEQKSSVSSVTLSVCIAALLQAPRRGRGAHVTGRVAGDRRSNKLEAPLRQRPGKLATTSSSFVPFFGFAPAQADQAAPPASPSLRPAFSSSMALRCDHHRLHARKSAVVAVRSHPFPFRHHQLVTQAFTIAAATVRGPAKRVAPRPPPS